MKLFFKHEYFNLTILHERFNITLFYSEVLKSNTSQPINL